MKECRHCGDPLKGRAKRNNIYCDEICNNLYKKEMTKGKIKNGEKVHPQTLRKHIIDERGHKCSCCGLSEWMGQEIPLELDHIDGDSTYNFSINLRLLCPNCHAQTDTYKGRNIGKGRASRRQRYADGKSY